MTTRGADGSERPGIADRRREQILHAAVEVISARGYGDTRIAGVAERAGVSAGLVIYYFKTKDRLLAEVIRYYDDAWYAVAQGRMTGLASVAARLEEMVAMCCLPGARPEPAGLWRMWLDFWAQAARNAEVADVRQQSDERWREAITALVREGQQAGEFRGIDAVSFAIHLCTLLDGFALQIVLEDPAVDSVRAFEISMRFAADQLGFAWTPGRGRGQPESKPGAVAPA